MKNTLTSYRWAELHWFWAHIFIFLLYHYLTQKFSPLDPHWCHLDTPTWFSLCDSLTRTNWPPHSYSLLQRTVVLEKTLESPLDCKEIQPVHPKDQSWMFIGRTDAEAETPILWPPDVKNWLIGKDPDAGKIEGRRRDGWMASPTRWAWVWVSSGRWWWTGRPAVLQSMGSQSQTWLSDWTDWWTYVTEIHL